MVRLGLPVQHDGSNNMTRPDWTQFIPQRERVKANAAAERMWWKLTATLCGAAAVFMGQAVWRAWL